jgi:hypothetical protein
VWGKWVRVKEWERKRERVKKIAVGINGAWIPLLVFMDVSLILLFLFCFHYFFLSIYLSFSEKHWNARTFKFTPI